MFEALVIGQYNLFSFIFEVKLAPLCHEDPTVKWACKCESPKNVKFERKEIEMTFKDTLVWNLGFKHTVIQMAILLNIYI